MSKNLKFVSLIGGFLALRLISMAFVPLAETTESRYAEIARVMAASSDWITPWFDIGVPFWGKPPLAFWVQALAFKTFGVNEFAARLPFWLATVATLWIIWRLANIVSTRLVARRTLIIYATSALVYVAAGAVLTDPFLALGTTWSMAAYYLAPGRPAWFWRYGFFLGLAIGLLAKGPLAGVLIFGPIVLWTILVPASRPHIKAIPWLKGTGLTLLIVLPWYIAAEIKTPGFLNYFIIGEHLMRFIDPGWSGDLYGSAHNHPKGTIWVQWLIASFPWGFIAIGMIIARLFSGRARTTLALLHNNPIQSYLLLWALFTPLFFTTAGNILWTYLLPALPAFSLLLAEAMGSLPDKNTVTSASLRVAVYLVPITTLAVMVLVLIKPDMLKSEKGMVAATQQISRAEKYDDSRKATLYYIDKPPFSARFYSSGMATEITFEALGKNEPQQVTYLAIPKKRWAESEQKLGMPLEKLFENRRYILTMGSALPHGNTD